ncbi:uncharacterized protein LOC134282846 [Saccostrea cucullata]|uniref:uncharacterized protein LOC134282846 n=1 Tax=Saccostrea cuccullata TaxID=36930 RepID=UPI002ED6ADD8
MGLIHSCLEKRSNKVGILSEEMSAHKKIEKEIENEVLEGKFHNKTVSWKMFCVASLGGKEADTGTENKMSDVVKTKDGMAFNIEFKSRVPKLPPIKIRSTSNVVQNEEHGNWKDEKEKLLKKKQDRANARRKEILNKRIMAAQRPKTARTRDGSTVSSFQEH